MVYRSRNYAKMYYQNKKAYLALLKKFPNRKVKRVKARNVFKIIRHTSSVHSITDGVDAHYFYAGTGSVAGSFKLEDVYNYSEFTALFDSYRIDKVVMHFKWSANAVSQAYTASATAQNMIPMLGIARDYDDSTVWTSKSTGLQYQDYKEYRLDKPFTITLYPRFASDVYDGLATGYAEGGRKTFIDCNSYDVPHYGCKWVIDIGTGHNTDNEIGKLHIVTDYHFSFKGVR